MLSIKRRLTLVCATLSLATATAALAEDSVERAGVVPLLIFFAAAIAGAVVLWRRSSRHIADKSFEFSVHTEIGEVMRERQYSQTEIAGTVNGGGMVYVGGTATAQPATSFISSKTTRFQEIFLKMPSGKEQVLEFVDFKVPCRESHKISILAVQRTGNPMYLCGYHNHATEESAISSDRVRAAVQPQKIGTGWIGWFAFFMFFLAGLLWFSGVTFGEDELAIEVISLAILAAVPTVIISLINTLRSKRFTKRHVPVVLQRINEVIADNERAINAAS